MAAKSLNPVASLDRLLELGLSPSQFGTCSEPAKKKVINSVDQVVNIGCQFWQECKMRNKPMPDGPAEERTSVMRPRPRYVKTRLIKPMRDGSGKDAIRENYCTCAQWHHDLKRRHQKNGEIAEICGGEGDPVLLRGTKRQKLDDGTLVDKQTFWKETIPAFPDPTQEPTLIADLYAAASRKADSQEQDDELNKERNRRMASVHVGDVAPVRDVTGEGTTEDLREALASPDTRSP